MKNIDDYIIVSEDGEEEGQMCEAVRELMEEGREEGIKEGKVKGIISTCKSLGTSKDTAVTQVMQQLEIEEQEARRLVDLEW